MIYMGKEIDKKIILGSIIAVVLITLTSITPVLGLQTNKTSSSVASPLFSIRTERAIRRESQNALTSNYIGKESRVRIPLTFHTRATISRNIIQRIKEIDDKTFDKLLAYITQETHNSDDLPPEILQAVYIIREETEKAMQQEYTKLDTVLCETLNCQTIRCNTVFAGCLTYRIFTGLIKILDGLYIYTEKIPLFTGTITAMLYQILINIYYVITHTLPS